MPRADPCRNNGKSGLVACPESVKKGCADALLIGRSCGLGQMPAGVCELGIEHAPIIGGCAPAHVSERLKPLDEPRAPATAEQYLSGQLCHAHLLAGRVVEEDQHLALRQGEAVRGSHLDVQLAEHVCVHLQEPAPSREFPRCERRDRGHRMVFASDYKRVAGCEGWERHLCC
jgi:hypothetical protein